MTEQANPTRLINLTMLKSKLPYLMSILQKGFEDNEPTLREFDLKYLLLVKLEIFCSNHLDDCECIE